MSFTNARRSPIPKYVQPASNCVRERERRERREAARAAAPDRQALAVDEALLGEVLGAGDAVVDVDDPPLALEPLAVVPSVAGRAAVVDVEHGVAAAREQLQCRSAKPENAGAVGPPWLVTMSGGSSPAGPTNARLVGG